MRSVTSVPTVVPLRFRDCSFASYRPDNESQVRALASARAVVDGTARNLVLVGPPGVGKTHLAAAILIERTDNEWAAWERAEDAATDRMPAQPPLPQWANVADLIVRLKMEMDAPLDDRDGRSLVARLRSSKGYVVLDDLGRERTSDWTGEVIYALVNARYENRLPTIVTSNLTPKELADSPYWPAISRLSADGPLVKVSGQDHRLKALSA